MVKLLFKVLRYTLILIIFILTLLLTVPYFFSIPQYALAKGARPFPESKFAVIHGHTIHYREWNSTSDSAIGNIILIHGFSGSTFSWRKNITALLEAGYNILIPDIPPFGFSTKDPNANYSVGANAALVWKLAEVLHPGFRWTLVGHSMGASIAGAMAALKPSQTNKVVFVDGIFDGIHKTTGLNLTGYLLSSGPVKQLAEVLGKYQLYNYKTFEKLLQSAYSKKPDSLDVVGYLRPFKLNGIAGGILAMSNSEEISSLSSNAIISPVLIIWGKFDDWLPLRKWSPLFKNYPTAELKIIDGAGHCPMETNANQFNSLLLKFISN